MRILLLVDKYFPHIQSCAKLMHDLGHALRDAGHQVLLATATPDLDAPRTLTDEDGITVLRIRSGRFRGVPLPLRAYNEWRLPALFWRHGADVFRRHPCDLIVQYAPPILLAPLTRRLRRLWGCPAYLVLRDIFPQWSVDAGILRAGSLPHRIFRHYEKMLYDAVDVVGVQSPRNLEYFADLDWGPYRLEVLYNWIAADGLEVRPSTLRHDLGLGDRVVMLYGGNLGVAQDPIHLARLADALRDDPQACLVVIGDGSEAGRLRAEAQALGLSNVHFMEPVDRATYLGLVEACDVGLITLHRGLKTHNFPGKMLDYLYFGKPILAAINPGNDLQDVLTGKSTGHEAGLVCENGDVDSMVRCARELLDDARRRRSMGTAARSLLESTFSAGRAARQIVDTGRKT